MTRRCRQRFALLALLALLLQQVAIAGHLCAPELAAMAGAQQSAAVDGAAHCHTATEAASQDDPAAHSDSGCRQHCDASQTRLDAGFAGSVPMLPPASAWQPVFKSGGIPIHRLATATPGSDPPPRQRFCSLLI